TFDIRPGPAAPPAAPTSSMTPVPATTAADAAAPSALTGPTSPSRRRSTSPTPTPRTTTVTGHHAAVGVTVSGLGSAPSIGIAGSVVPSTPVVAKCEPAP